MKKHISDSLSGARSGSQAITVPFGTAVGLALRALSIIPIIVSLTATAVAQGPDLKPGRPSGWTAPVEVTAIASKPVVRASWFNDSRAAVVMPFYSLISVDGRGVVRFRQDHLDGGWGAKTNYYRLGLLKKGRHTAKLAVDDTNVVRESAEGNNTYSLKFEYDGLHFPLPDKKEHRKVTHGFGRPWDANPTQRTHNGADFRASRNTAVYAAYDGKVLGTGTYAGWGGWIVVGHDERIDGAFKWTSLYLHVNAKATKGDQVYAGNKIAEVAPLTSGDHLHFGIRLGPISATATEIDLSAKGALASQSRYVLSNVPLFPEQYVDPLEYIEGDFEEFD